MIRRPHPRLIAMALLTLAGHSPASGHGELHDRIAELGTQIGRRPDDATLYFRRAEMRRLHQEWTGAEEDYHKAATLNPQLAAVRLGRATLRLDCGHATEAEKLATDYLREAPGQSDGLLLRARARAAQGRVDAAARDYDDALASLPTATPDVYLERAAMLANASPPRRDAALHGLEEGLRRLGPLLTLQAYAVEIEVANGRLDAALARVENVLTAHPRHLEWLAKKWHLLQSAGRTEPAAAARAATLSALEALPARRRLLPAMAELERRVRANDPGPPQQK